MEIKTVERKNKNCFQAELRCGNSIQQKKDMGLRFKINVCLTALLSTSHIHTAHKHGYGYQAVLFFFLKWGGSTKFQSMDACLH
jgi:hypothetical protein